MGNVQSIPEKAEGHVTQAEKDEFDAYRNGEANLRHEGINVGKDGFYDPNAGSKYVKNEVPDRTPVPAYFTGSGDVAEDQSEKHYGTKVISREKNAVLDRSETPSGRKDKAQPKVDSSK